MLSHPIHHPSVTPFMPLRARKKDKWMAQKMCSKESAYSREMLEEIKNHYIKEENAWKHFFAEINNNHNRRKLLGFES